MDIGWDYQYYQLWSDNKWLLQELINNEMTVMNIEWDYNYYQPQSDNEWLVDEMLAMLDEDITMQ